MLRGGDCWSRIAMGNGVGHLETFGLALAVIPRSPSSLPNFSIGGYGGDHAGHEQLATTRLRADHDRQFGLISGAFAPEIERFVYG